MPKNNKKPVDKRRWPGVLYYESKTQKIRGRSDVCYYIRYTLSDGRKRLEKVGWKSEGYTPQVGAEIRADRIRKVRHGEAVKTAKEIAREKQQQDRALNDIKEAYFSGERGQKLKGRKTDLNRYDKHIKRLLGKRPISSLAPLDVDRIKTNMKGLAPATIANALELLRRIVNYGVEKKLCLPLSFTIKVPKVNNEVTEYLEPEEAARFANVLDSWPSQDVSRMLKLAMLSGMRRGEVFKLEDRDLKFTHGLIELRDPKGGPTVSIPMSKPVIELLQVQIKWRNGKYPNSPFIFPGRRGGMRVDCSAVKRIKVEADLPKKFRIFHGLRHHFAVMLANSGEFSLDMIGELLTHKSAEMTKRYSKYLPGTMKKASNRAAELLLNQTEPEKKIEALSITK
jgi:integrase